MVLLYHGIKDSKVKYWYWNKEVNSSAIVGVLVIDIEPNNNTLDWIVYIWYMFGSFNIWFCKFVYSLLRKKRDILYFNSSEAGWHTSVPAEWLE